MLQLVYNIILLINKIQIYITQFAPTDGLASSKPNRDIERKWFDSLIGYDTRNRPVPDNTLGPKKKYGILNNPKTEFICKQY